jgi:hypothetical protein
MDTKDLWSYPFMKFISTIMMNLTKEKLLLGKIYKVDPLAMKVLMKFLDKNR